MLVKFKRLKHFIYTSNNMKDALKKHEKVLYTSKNIENPTSDVFKILEFNSDGLKIQFLYWHGIYTYLIDLYCDDNKKETYSRVFRICEFALWNDIDIAFKDKSFMPKYLPIHKDDKGLYRFNPGSNLTQGPDGYYRIHKISKIFRSDRHKFSFKYKELSSSFVIARDLKTLESEIRKVHGSANIDYVMRENCKFPAIAHVDDKGSTITVSVLSISEVNGCARLI